MSWWTDRAPRERWLISFAGGLIVVLALFQFVLVPLQSWRADAARDYRDAEAVLMEVETGAAEAAVLKSTARPASETVDVRSTAGTLARSMGLTVTTVQPSPRGVGMTFADVEARLLFQWLERLERDHGVTVARAAVRANDDRPTVRAEITLAVGGAI